MRNKIVVYHGTNEAFDSVKLDKSRNKRDFGRGFYTTTVKEQASAWADNMVLRYGGEATVIEYEITMKDELKIKQFDGLCKEWLEMVKDNRLNGGVQHGYDIVIGPVANDNTMRTVSLYVSGIYTTEAALEQLKYFKANNQISLHTEKALDALKEIARYHCGKKI